ncbi:MAG TPA: M15 family metallopeptidase [Candidatus Saccharibacteria bacterium]|nr:M15 family metallopeptidase [Candidatus Saccharibacteria bacterium]
MSMQILEATNETLTLDGFTRAGYSFGSRIGDIARHEIGESFVTSADLRTAGFLLEPFWETAGDLEGDAYRNYIDMHPEFELSVRQGVFERLKVVQDILIDDWQLVLKAGYRPPSVQQDLLAVFQEKSMQDHPDWSDDRHLAHARTFVSDPRLLCPPHTTGGAIDIDVRNHRTGELIDFGCPPNTDDERAFLFSDQLINVQMSNRHTLLRAMLAAGFAPNPHEWWHYQYGETYWAAFYGHKTTLYDILYT